MRRYWPYLLIRLLHLQSLKQENNYQFDLLSDFNKEVSTAYGAIYEEFIFGLKGVSKRAAFVIDEDQNIIYAEVLEVATDLPDFNAIARSSKVILKNIIRGLKRNPIFAVR